MERQVKIWEVVNMVKTKGYSMRASALLTDTDQNRLKARVC